jgi:hypothetical protein
MPVVGVTSGLNRTTVDTNTKRTLHVDFAFLRRVRNCCLFERSRYCDAAFGAADLARQVTKPRAMMGLPACPGGSARLAKFARDCPFAQIVVSKGGGRLRSRVHGETYVFIPSNDAALRAAVLVPILLGIQR